MWLVCPLVFQIDNLAQMLERGIMINYVSRSGDNEDRTVR